MGLVSPALPAPMTLDELIVDLPASGGLAALVSDCRSALQALSELVCSFDGWARIAWFAKPKCGLAHRRAADVLGVDFPRRWPARASTVSCRRLTACGATDMEPAGDSISRLCATEHCKP